MKIPRKKREQGQSLVEFAITLPVLLLIMSGLLDLGRAYYTFIALEEAVAEAALYLAISPDCPDDDTNGDDTVDSSDLSKCVNPNNARYRAENSGNAEFDSDITEWNIPYDSAAIDACVNTGGDFPNCWDDPFPQSCTSIGCNVLVQVEYPFEILTPGMQAFADRIYLSTQAAQIIVYDQQ